MPDSRVIPTSRAKSALVLLASIGFVALGVWMSGEKPVLGWVCAGFFALGIPVSLAMLLTDKFSLRLGRQVAEAMSGMEGAIPNHYAMPLPELLAELRAWHACHGRTQA